MYRFTGKHELMKMDLVQFVYAFVITPVMYIWLKIFLFYVLRPELNLRLSLGEIFLLDGVFTLLFLYVFAFVVIHSLTKTFGLRKDDNPRYNLFADSEYYHQLLSHVAVYCGAGLLFLLVGLVNIFIPFPIVGPLWWMYCIALFGFVGGGLGLAAIWMYETPDRRFYRLMKLFAGIMFVVEVWIFIIASPSFTLSYSVFWFMFSCYFSLAVLSLVADRPRPDSWWERLPFMINWRKPRNDFSRYIKTVKGMLYG
jgi:hypothetical protein